MAEPAHKLDAIQLTEKQVRLLWSVLGAPDAADFYRFHKEHESRDQLLDLLDGANRTGGGLQIIRSR